MTHRHPDPAVQLLVDRAEIHDVMMRYAAGVDRRDFELVTSCFTPDVVAATFGTSGRDALIDFIRGVSHFHTTMHMMGNQFIEVDGDTASMDTYAMLTHHANGNDGEPYELSTSGNQYIEKLTRVEGGWAIHHRGGEPVWSPRGVLGVTTADDDVRWLLDRAELHDLMMHYALGIDLREYERIGRCFAPEFHAAYGPMEFTDLGELLAFIKGVEHFVSTTHFLGTHLAEVDGHVARMETYAMVTHREEKDGAPHEWMAGGSSYVDALAKIDGRWVITERGPAAGRVGVGPPGVRSSTDVDVQRLLDRALIGDLVATSALAIDRRDWDVFEACFDGSPDIDGVRADVEQWHATCHFLNNQLVEIDGDEARTETYAYVTHRESAVDMESPWAHGARRFVDRLVRDADGWRIAERQVLDNRVQATTGGSNAG